MADRADRHGRAAVVNDRTMGVVVDGPARARAGARMSVKVGTSAIFRPPLASAARATEPKTDGTLNRIMVYKWC